MKPAGAQRLIGNTWYLPGLTNSGYVDGLVIDTGSECDVYRQAELDTLVVTHGHADHFAAGAVVRGLGAMVFAGRDDARLVENPEVNIRGMFSWARPGDLLVTKLFMGTPCPVDGLVEEWSDPRAIAVPMPGHTLGHHGVLTADGVLFSGDALYQKQIWDRHCLPYSIDPGLVSQTLRGIGDLDFEILVPGHGEPCSRDEALVHADHHLERLARIDSFLMRELATEKTTEEAIALVSEMCGLSDNPAQYWLAVTTVKGFLGDLLARDEIEFFVREHAGWWRAKT